MTITSPHTIAITGATGLVGKRLTADLRALGHTVYPLRRGTGPSSWNVDTGEISTPTPADTVIHLAGQNIATRWTPKVKQALWDSRVPATRHLASFLAQLPADRRPTLLISASAIGVYGNRGDELLTESSPLPPPNTSFMADIGREWESAADPARAAGIRVVHPRIGIVLAKNGGALAKLVTPTRLFLGGPVGKGTQWMPPISLTDLCRLFIHLVTTNPDFAGPVNAVAPTPVRQHEFMRTLGKVLHRPTLFPLPAFMVKLAFGQMGVDVLLSSLRVVPTRIPQDFTFLHPTLESALRAELA